MSHVVRQLKLKNQLIILFFIFIRFIEISKILYRIVENKDIREYNMIETKAGARVNIDC